MLLYNKIETGTYSLKVFLDSLEGEPCLDYQSKQRLVKTLKNMTRATTGTY